jgi:C-type lysozyme/alpha-lactalbumin family
LLIFLLFKSHEKQKQNYLICVSKYQKKMLIFKSSVIIILLIVQLIVAKVYNKCELAKELYEIYGVPFEKIGTYVCIAERQSNFNTQALGQGSYYGIYQISSEYWCDNTGFTSGKACGLHCNNLLDDNLSDDLQCMRTIIDEHERISGNGFNAWPSGLSCQEQGNSYIADCSIESNQIIANYDKIIPQQRKTSISGNVGKVYERCELARELRFNYDIPMEHIATWVCIAKHESSFNTSAIGRLNWDGSEDHGLFQISDIYWCGETGKACGLKCDELRDNDISNDVQCILKIHEEHTRLSGDGFNAWAVYPRCKGQSESYVVNCFGDVQQNEVLPFQPLPGVQQPAKPKVPYRKSNFVEEGKVYEQCELARELRDKHKIPFEQIATW